MEGERWRKQFIQKVPIDVPSFVDGKTEKFDGVFAVLDCHQMRGGQHGALIVVLISLKKV